MNRFRIRNYAAAAALIFSAMGGARQACAAPVATIDLDGAAVGRPFEGLGAVSGGGNTSRLLPDYPAAQKKQILDYLFKPGFGASLSEFKVEVGGDVNSTEGSEPSHMHTRDDEDYSRGFEWWLMEQAKARNPQISLDCLAWGAPGWVGNGNFWSTDMMDYYIKFIKGAKKYHGLEIGSVGGKNERGFDRDWYIGFRKALDANGLSHVKLVASDDWGPYWIKVADASVTDPEFSKAIDVFGAHITWSENPPLPTEAIQKLGKPFWDTELHNYYPGFESEISLIQAFNRNYIRAKITKNMVWNLIWSYYSVSSYPDVGMMRANSPWSGHYEVLPVLWGYAHVNQFVKPGWLFLENGGNGELPGGGTYTALKSPNGRDYSLIVETKDAPGAQLVRFNLTHGMPAKALHIWKSTADAQFVHSGDLTPADGAVTISLEPNCVYSITTTEGQRKGSYPASPADAPLKLPYQDNYQSYRVGAQARYHFDYHGAFEIAKGGPGHPKVLRQMATNSASGWGGAYLPLMFLGSSDWEDYTVSADAYIEKAGAVAIHGRIGVIPNDNNFDPPGYTFRIQDSGAWELSSFKTVIAHGDTSFSADRWHRLQLGFQGSQITASVDGKAVATVSDTTYAGGLVGLGTGWNFAQFANLKVEPIGAQSAMAALAR
ncbi:MAG: putative galactocerebrosidase [Capsulimonas sp.]|nr:putative galactocerebrosidase [Capsulimonas sp.]